MALGELQGAQSELQGGGGGAGSGGGAKMCQAREQLTQRVRSYERLDQIRERVGSALKGKGGAARHERWLRRWRQCRWARRA